MLAVHLLVRRSPVSHVPDARENFFPVWQSSLSNLSLEWDLRLPALLCETISPYLNVQRFLSPRIRACACRSHREDKENSSRAKGSPKGPQAQRTNTCWKVQKYFIVVKCINLMCNSNQIRLWAVCPVVHKKVSRVNKIVRFPWDTVLDLVIFLLCLIIHSSLPEGILGSHPCSSSCSGSRDRTSYVNALCENQESLWVMGKLREVCPESNLHPSLCLFYKMKCCLGIFLKDLIILLF